MNLALLDLEVFELPAVIEDRLTPPGGDDAATCAFNRRGNLLAAGCQNGAVIVWDFDTHGAARTLLGHTGRVTSVSWTRSSRRLLSSSTGGQIILWDVLAGSAIQTIEMGDSVTPGASPFAPRAACAHLPPRSSAPRPLRRRRPPQPRSVAGPALQPRRATSLSQVLSATLHPRKRSLCLACVGSASSSAVSLISLDPHAERRVPLTPAGMEPASADAAADEEASTSKRHMPTSAIFNAEGDIAMITTSRGAVHLLDSTSGATLHTVQLPGASAIKSIVLSRDGKSFVTNSGDRVIRAYPLGRLLAGEKVSPRELQDVVNRVQWSHAGFASESEHVIGTSNSATDHSVYIWDMHGHLSKILDGPKDGALHFAYHPTRPILACCARSGAVYVWTKRYSENWSAFAPDFKELEENEEYEEREDEFDIVPELKKVEEEAEEEKLDIVTTELTELEHVPDADDDEQELLFLPVTPIPEEAGRAAEGAEAMEVDGRGGKTRKRKSEAPPPAKPGKRA